MSLCRILIVRYSRFSPRTSRFSRFTTVPAPWCGYTTLSPTLYKLTPLSVCSRESAGGPEGSPAKDSRVAETLQKRHFCRVFEKSLLRRASRRAPAASAAERLGLERRALVPAGATRREAELAAFLDAAGRPGWPAAGGPVSPISPKAASPSRTGTPLRGGGDRERDPEVGARLVDADAAGDVDEDVGAARAAGRRGARARRRSSRAASGRRRSRRGAASRGRSARRAPGSRAAAAACPRACR